MWEIFTYILHGLAYFGVWLLNVIIYEIIAIFAWLLPAIVIWNSPIPDERGERFVGRWGVLLCIAVGVAAICYCIGWLRIVPLPVFG